MVSNTNLSIYTREEAGVNDSNLSLLTTVSRIAYLCSDVIFSVQANLTNSGLFLPTLDHLFSTKCPNILRGEIPQVPNHLSPC